MKKIITIALVILVISLGGHINAQEKIMVLEDTFVQGGNTSNSVMGKEAPKQLKVFNSDKDTKYARTTYLKFELPKNLDNVSKITLHIAVKVFDKNAPGKLFKLDIYAINNNNWSEDKLTFNNKPSLDRSMIGSLSIPSSSNHEKVSIDLDVNSLKKQLHETKVNIITLALLNTDFNKTSAMMPSKEKSKRVASYLTIEN